MKIVIDGRILGASTGRYVEKLLDYLQKIDHKNHYCVLMRREQFEDWEFKSENFEKVLADYEIYSFKEQVNLVLLLRRLDPDLVHFTMPQQPLLYFKKRVTTIHDLTLLNFKNVRGSRFLYQLKLLVFRVVLKVAVRKSERLLVPTKFVKRQLISRYDMHPEKIAVTYEAADKIRLSPKHPNNIPEPFVLYVGNAHPNKNLHRLIDGFGLLTKKMDDVTLVMAGRKDYFYEQLEQYVEEKNLSSRVNILGYVSDRELRWLYENASIYVFPSLSEGFGLPGLEAMQYGLPVVSSEATCLPEVYGSAAYYFDPTKPESIAHGMEETLTNKELRKQLVRHGHNRVERFSWQQTAKETLGVYEGVGSR